MKPFRLIQIKIQTRCKVEWPHNERITKAKQVPGAYYPCNSYEIF